MNTQSRLHIAHIVDLRVIGGIERMALEFILATPNVQHSLVLFDKNIHPSLETKLGTAKNVVGINKISLWTEWAYMLEYVGRFEEAIEKYKEIIPMQNNLEKLDQLKSDIERVRKKSEMLKL